MTRTRTDVHAPASPDFDPEKYTCHGVFDFTPDYGNDEIQRRRDTVNDMLANGYRFGGSASGCGHCGTHIRYGALMARDDVMEMIWVGETCLGNRFDGMTKTEFQRLRKAAALNREGMARQERIDALIKEFPFLDSLSDPDLTARSPFLSDLGCTLHFYGRLTDRQIQAAEKAIIRDNERMAARARRDADESPAAPVPTGKTVITGTVIKLDTKHNDYGVREVMTVKNAAGWLVWGTVPKSLASSIETGATVTFTATIAASDKPEFGFYTRPTKASITA